MQATCQYFCFYAFQAIRSYLNIKMGSPLKEKILWKDEVRAVSDDSICMMKGTPKTILIYI